MERLQKERNKERLQKLALRAVCLNYNSTYTELPKRANVPFLYMSIMVRNQMVDVFKLLSQGNSPKHQRKLFKEREHCYNTTNILSLVNPEI